MSISGEAFEGRERVQRASLRLRQPQRRQVEERSGGKVEKHLRDGGNLRTTGIEPAQADHVELLIPPKMAKSALRRGREPEPKPGGSEAVLAWKQPATSFAPGSAVERRTAHQME